jgi:hypothetical protein
MSKLIKVLRSQKKLVILIVLLFVAFLVLFIVKNTESKTETTTTITYNQTESEKRLCSILQCIKGVGQTEVLINEGDEGITGVVIVCEGGDSILVKNDILNVVSTALNINKSIIAIYSM